MGDLFLVVNPAARHGQAARIWPGVARRLKARDLTFEAVFTRQLGDGTALAREALGRGARVVVAVGGDGTANEVANGFFGVDSTLVVPEARFGFIPTGTGTDLARSLGFPRHDLDAAIAALGPGGRHVAVDVGRVRYVAPDGRPIQRYFLNGADLGLGGETAAMARSTASWAKRLGGFGAYLVAATLAILRHRPRRVQCVVDSVRIKASTDIIFVANGSFIGGGMLVAPGASLDDGWLDVIVLRSVGKADLLFRLLPGIYRGAHLRHPAVTVHRARHVEVTSTEPLLLQLDGEQPGTSPAAFDVVPRALPILLPPASKSDVRS